MNLGVDEFRDSGLGCRRLGFRVKDLTCRLSDLELKGLGFTRKSPRCKGLIQPLGFRVRGMLL